MLGKRLVLADGFVHLSAHVVAQWTWLLLSPKLGTVTAGGVAGVVEAVYSPFACVALGDELGGEAVVEFASCHSLFIL